MKITWKLATAGLAVTAIAAFAIGVTTVHLMRPARADAEKPLRAPSPAPAPYRELPSAPGTSTKPLIYHPGPPPAKPARTTVTVPRATPIADRPDSRPPVAATPPSGTDPVPAANPEPALESEPQAMDSTTGQERAWKVARPGILGAMIGAGVGAAGGALTDGGEGAAKGALPGSDPLVARVPAESPLSPGE